MIKLSSYLYTVCNISRSVIFLIASLVTLITMTQKLQFLKTEASNENGIVQEHLLSWSLCPTAKC